MLARVIWVLVGLMRLRSMRWDAEMVSELVGVSAEVSGPVTFGFFRPVILVPPEVMEMPEALRESILAHERAHVRRRDWAFALAEEAVLCVLWFHPLVWMLVGQIRLAREQVVDLEAAGAAGSREVYVEALLAVADVRLQPYFAPAPPFLRRRQLAARIHSLVKEIPMSRVRLMSSYALAAVCTLGLGVWITTAFPLRGAPQLQEDISVEGAELIFRPPMGFPMAAQRAGVEGPVALELTLAPNGEVADARVVSGAMELRKAALDAVLKWQFKPGGGVARVVMQMRPKPYQAINQIKVTAVHIADDVPAAIAQTLRARLDRFVGQRMSVEIYEIVKGVDPSLVIRSKIAEDGSETTVEIMKLAPSALNIPGRIRVGAQVQAANRLDNTQPQYPPLARQARIQGTVRFNAAIARDGSVIGIEVVSGHPLLIPAASEAIRQYRYKPTLLNGQPVEVTTQVDVNFSL